MTDKRVRLFTLAILVSLSAGAVGQAPKRLSFVSCPIVQDTPTVPCWLSSNEGEEYYLGIQTDISAEFDPPYLGHPVLVEGIVSSEPRICGGVVLKPVVVSPLQEPDQSCNVIRPAVPQFTVPFAPRPPGPSGGRLAFDAPPPATASLKPPYQPRTFELIYDVDMLVMGRHSYTLSDVLDYAKTIHGTRIRISGGRGSMRLSNGRVITERAGIGRSRAEEVADLLKRAGLQLPMDVAWRDEAEPADGVDDWRSRRATITVEP
jgi:signal recognition particle subunit SEC65